MATDVMVDAERVKERVLPRVLNEMADVVDKISNAEAPLTHVQVWLVGAILLTGLAMRERFVNMPKVSNELKDSLNIWGGEISPSEGIVSDIESGWIGGRWMEDPLTRTFVSGQVDLFKEMVGEKDFGIALIALASISMAVFGTLISEKANQPVKISERVGKLPGVGETISKNLRNLSGAIQKGK